MTDFLIVHDVGQSAWFWNRVWGYATAPAEHPPRLAAPECSRQFYLANLPGHGSDEEGDTAEVRLDECTQAIVRAVERRGMRDLVLVGHGVGGMIALQAVSQLSIQPKRLVLVAGVVPEPSKSALSQIPISLKKNFSARFNPGKFWGKEVRFSRAFVTRYLCNGMDTRDITQALGFFGPLPTLALETKVEPSASDIPCPVSYVILDQDKLLPPTLQISMARQIPEIELIHLDSCHQASLQKPVEMGKLLVDIGERNPRN